MSDGSVRRSARRLTAAGGEPVNEVVAEESATNPNFKKIWESYSKFRADYAIWRDAGYLK